MPLFQGQSNLAIAMIGVVTILGLATLGYGLLDWFSPSRNLPKIGSRIRFLWILTAMFLLAISYSPGYMTLYLAFLSFLALKEYLSITPTRRADRRVLFWAYLAVPFQFCWVWQGWYEALVSFIPLYIFFFLPLLMVTVGETEGFLRASSTLSWGLVITVFSLGHLAYLLMLPQGGAGLFLFLLILTQLNDVAQFLFGKIFRHERLRLKVTQSRNWASLFGGMAIAALLGWLAAPLLTPFSAAESIAIGVIIALASFIGYVAMSAIKSDLQLKDRGSMTPGRGGILNRVDTLIYTAPIFLHLVLYLQD
jgi:phosphatidate cytidylyltransferase